MGEPRLVDRPAPAVAALGGAGLWAACLVAGQAFSLTLTAAGPHMRYQHLLSFGAMRDPDLVFVAAYVAVVGAGAYWHRRTLASVLRSFGHGRLAAGVVLLSLSSATVSRDVGFYAYELLAASAAQIVFLANAWLVAATLPDAVRDRVERVLLGHGDSGASTGRWRRVAAGCAVGVAIMSAVLAWAVYERHPHVGDENAYLFHARVLAEGRLSLTTPPVPEAFTIDLVDSDGARWFAATPPGWPAVLAIGVRLGAGWLVNPLLAALCLFCAVVLVRELYDDTTARLAALLMVASPWHLFLGMSFMTHMASQLLALLGALAAVRARRAEGRAANRWAVGSGLAIGAVGFVRPLEGVVVAAAVGPWLVGLGGRRLSALGIASWVVGGAVSGCLTLGYNYAMTGDPSVFPLMAWSDRYMGPNTNAIGFGPDRGVGWALDPYPGHSPVESVINGNLNVTAINHELFGWASGSLLAVVAALLWGRRAGADAALWYAIAMVVAAHGFYWYSGGPDFGARYWYLTFVPLVGLSVRGLLALSGAGAHAARASAHGLVVALVLSLSATVTFVPWRAADKYFRYLGMRGDVRTWTSQGAFPRGLVLVRGPRTPDWSSAATYNPTDFTTDAPLFAWDGPDLRPRLVAAYPDRPVWVVDGPTRTGSGYRVVAGPLTGEQALRLPPSQEAPDWVFKPRR